MGNWSVSSELRQQFDFECQQIDRLMDEYRPLLARFDKREPDAFERAALATMLHSFYTGVENILKRVAVACDGGLPAGENWHRDLLASMVRPGDRRPGAISETARQALRPYLGFRHVFRQGYGFDLQWDKMSPLVRNCEQTWRLVQPELSAFLNHLDPES
jgi:hypothetical protein